MFPWDRSREERYQERKAKKEKRRQERERAERHPFVARKGDQAVRPTTARIYVRAEPYSLRKMACKGCKDCQQLDDHQANKKLVERAMQQGVDVFQKETRCPRMRYAVYAAVAENLQDQYAQKEADVRPVPGQPLYEYHNDLHEVCEDVVEASWTPRMKQWATRLHSMYNAHQLGVSGAGGKAGDFRALRDFFASAARQHGAQL